MTFTESINTCFKKYADFNGYASRSEYWWFFLFVLVAGMVLGQLSFMLNLIFSLGTLVPGLAAGARRLHDTDRSGWWQLLWLIPLFGWIVLIIFLAQEGNPANRAQPAAPVV